MESAEIAYLGAASKSGTVWEGIHKQALPSMSVPLGAERACKAGDEYSGVTRNACQMRLPIIPCAPEGSTLIAMLVHVARADDTRLKRSRSEGECLLLAICSTMCVQGVKRNSYGAVSTIWRRS